MIAVVILIGGSGFLFFIFALAALLTGNPIAIALAVFYGLAFAWFLIRAPEKR